MSTQKYPGIEQCKYDLQVPATMLDCLHVPYLDALGRAWNDLLKSVLLAKNELESHMTFGSQSRLLMSIAHYTEVKICFRWYQTCGGRLDLVDAFHVVSKGK